MAHYSNSNDATEASSLVESEALAWIAQLNGDDVTEKDLAAFRDWVNRSPVHQREIRELLELWNGLNLLTIMDEPIREADKVSRQLRKKETRKNWKNRVLMPGLVGAFAVASATFVILPEMMMSDRAAEYRAELSVPLVFKTAKGEHQTHLLEDGSTIVLNTDSHIEVDFNAGQRDVRLLKGEALFSVAHDEKRPFLVFADDGIVRAVGTEFSVHLIAGAFDVLVSEGSVELSMLEPTMPTAALTPTSAGVTKVASLGVIEAGHTAMVKDSKASIAILSHEDIDAELSWRAGRLDFTGEDLEEAVAEYTRYTDYKIVILDPELKTQHVGGSFPIGETDLFFKALELQFGIVVTRSGGNTVYLSSAG